MLDFSNRKQGLPDLMAPPTPNPIYQHPDNNFLGISIQKWITSPIDHMLHLPYTLELLYIIFTAHTTLQLYVICKLGDAAFSSVAQINNMHCAKLGPKHQTQQHPTSQPEKVQFLPPLFYFNQLIPNPYQDIIPFYSRPPPPPRSV